MFMAFQQKGNIATILFSDYNIIQIETYLYKGSSNSSI